MYLSKNEWRKSLYWNYFTVFTRFWGILTATVMCGVGVDFLLHRQIFGVYVILGSLSVLFFEVTWAITNFLKVYLQKGHSKLFHIWNSISQVKNWWKTVLYLIISVFLFLRIHQLMLTSIAGAMLILLGVFHFILSFRTPKNKNIKECLLQSQDGHSERNEENIFEVLDNSMKSKEEITVDEPGGNVLEI